MLIKMVERLANEYCLYANPGIGMDVIEQTEKELLMVFPEEVKLFLTVCNGCWLKNPIIYKENVFDFHLVGFLPLEYIKTAVLQKRIGEMEYHYLFTDVLFAFGDCGGVSSLEMGYAGLFEKKIYTLNYQNFDGENPDSMLKFVANSLEELLDMIFQSQKN